MEGLEVVKGLPSVPAWVPCRKLGEDVPYRSRDGPSSVEAPDEIHADSQKLLVMGSPIGILGANAYSRWEAHEDTLWHVIGIEVACSEAIPFPYVRKSRTVPQQVCNGLVGMLAMRADCIIRLTI